MLLRNLLFLTLCLAVALVFHASVFPPEVSHSRPLAAVKPGELTPIVARVDESLTASWNEKNLRPAPIAPDLQIARRLSLALTGTIPSLAEIRLFESQPADGRIEWWLSSLLADRRYADYVAERLARAYVGVDDGPVLLYRRRRFVAWLADQLSENRRYDQIVRHLIADSGLWTDTPATNFITVTIKPNQDEGPDEKELAAKVSRAFLGIRIDCAECHDHPFDQWKQKDFQQLAAFFGNTRQGFTGISDGKDDYEVEDRVTGKSAIVPPIVPFQSELVPGEGSRRRQLAVWVTHEENRAFARATVNRAWALLFGRPLVEPIDNIPQSGSLPPVLDLLAADFVEHGYDWQRLLRVIAASRVFRADSQAEPSEGKQELTAEHVAAWAAFPLTRLRPEQVVGALLQSASLSTIDYESHILVRIARQTGQSDFIKRYGDGGAEEFDQHGGTIPQRLLMMNGNIVREKTKEDVIGNASTRIAALAPDDTSAVETAMLAVLTRRPTAEESQHFIARIHGAKNKQRNARLEDLYWTLLNTTEFSWNH